MRFLVITKPKHLVPPEVTVRLLDAIQLHSSRMCVRNVITKLEMRAKLPKLVRAAP